MTAEISRLQKRTQELEASETERKRAEQELVTRNCCWRKFLWGNDPDDHIEKILQPTEKSAAIIQNLLTLARRGVTASDMINLNGVVSDFLKTPVFERIKDHLPRVTFRTERDKNLLNIKGSPIHPEKVLMNLLSNAAEAISGKGDVTIRTKSRYLDKPLRGYDEIKAGDYTVLTVSDTGTGWD